MKNSTNQMATDFKKELALIIRLSKAKRMAFQTIEERSRHAILVKNTPKGFRLGMDQDQTPVGSDVSLSVSNRSLKLTVKGFLRKRGYSSTDTRGPFQECAIWHFEDLKLNRDDKYYCRKILPLKHGVDFYRLLAESGLGIRISDASFKCDDFTFKLMPIDRGSFSFLSIECMEPIHPERFSEITWSILVALGFLTGYLLQDEEYTFFYNDSKKANHCSFEYKQLRDSIKGFYQPVNSNPYAWVRKGEDAKRFDGKLTGMFINQFSKLCDEIHSSIHIKSLILLMLESSNSSLLVMPAGLSVALEGFAEYFYESNEELLNPISDKRAAGAFRKDLMKVLASYSQLESFKALKVLESKINDINKPTNKEKLKSPFKILGIELSDRDEIAIGYRNAFLHGDIILEQKGRFKSDKMTTYEIALRLLTMLNSIVLKMVGFEGYILDQVKLQENDIIKAEGDYYRWI